MQGVGLFLKLLIEKVQIRLFFLGRPEVPFSIVSTPDFVKRETGFQNQVSGKAGHGTLESNPSAKTKWCPFNNLQESKPSWSRPFELRTKHSPAFDLRPYFRASLFSLA